ncbi:hypothetical protein [Dubosiella newyorkensis]|uniref:hypothetical protein n=1 Tax=Dubosiella newyorkensis TaxID=1862672 RepID=UPI00272A50B3|nr:hypothetical protein [Dubosiella newyorkensis]
MKLDALIVYEEEYLPSKRHRIPRKREVEEVVHVELVEKSRSDFSLAFTVHDYQSRLGADGESEYGIVSTEYLTDKENLYVEMWERQGALILQKSVRDNLEKKINHDLYWRRSNFHSKEEAMKFLEEKMNQYIMIDGVIYEQASEPRYVIATFGLGHNHGGTSYFIGEFYNPNISKHNYYNALEYDKMKKRALEIAKNRGDTEDIPRIQESNVKIEVHDPSMVKCNPQQEHDLGNPFLNSLENIIQGSPDAVTAGLSVMAKTAGMIEGDYTMESVDDSCSDMDFQAEDDYEMDEY